MICWCQEQRVVVRVRPDRVHVKKVTLWVTSGDLAVLGCAGVMCGVMRNVFPCVMRILGHLMHTASLILGRLASEIEI
ncbi:hypothetical protein Pmani_032757 [Petrolisthes manimaculis]|uniref:Uncharacterized protein n=1 Tax=Petrolisthes manimaculis TaxID=1843537 RepID=A0AAE1NSX5_9EUCA|nr:hypothetical protein Pmani_032757 [Petrolisthes manimaculis]